jgi:hypothetical protein
MLRRNCIPMLLRDVIASARKSCLPVGYLATLCCVTNNGLTCHSIFPPLLLPLRCAGTLTSSTMSHPRALSVFAPALVRYRLRIFFVELQSRVVICCWPSPAQSFLVFCPFWTHDYALFVPRPLMCSEMGPCLRREEGYDFYCRLPPI